MEKTPIYGLPLNPMPLLEELAGASFCVSYATRAKLGRQLDDAIRLVGEDGILLVDNGAFSMHKQGLDTRDEAYQDAYEAWALDILDRCPQAVAVIPDFIDGSVVANAELVNTTLLPADRAMPVWHMHEPLAYLLHLCEGFGYVGVGSSGQYWQVGTPEWHARMGEVFAAIDAWEAETGAVRPRLHLMRAQAQAHAYPFDSSDSTNVAMNHGRYRAEGPGHVARHAGRAAARIVASAGPEAAHQTLRPLLDHLEAAAWAASLDQPTEQPTEEHTNEPRGRVQLAGAPREAGAHKFRSQSGRGRRAGFRRHADRLRRRGAAAGLRDSRTPSVGLNERGRARQRPASPDQPENHHTRTLP